MSKVDKKNMMDKIEEALKKGTSAKGVTEKARSRNKTFCLKSIS